MIKTILLDMGGVVFLQDTQEALKRFSQLGVDTGKYMGAHEQKGPFLALEKGDIDAVEFCNQISDLVGRKVSAHEAYHCWLGYLKRVPQERLDNIKSLRNERRVCLASNTNPFMMSHTRSKNFSQDGHSIEDYFDKLYCSYEMKAYKPDEAFFRKILEEEKVLPSEVVFVDDSARNVEAARKLGIVGLLVSPDADWMKDLQQILDNDK